jgi:hypothetical protein
MASRPRHPGIAGKVAVEEPQVRVDVEFGDELALAVMAAFFADADDTVEHQHVGSRQLRITGAEEFALAALQQLLTLKRVLLGH